MNTTKPDELKAIKLSDNAENYLIKEIAECVMSHIKGNITDVILSEAKKEIAALKNKMIEELKDQVSCSLITKVSAWAEKEFNRLFSGLASENLRREIRDKLILDTEKKLSEFYNPLQFRVDQSYFLDEYKGILPKELKSIKNVKLLDSNKGEDTLSSSGIYFLYLGDTLQYIGKTYDVKDRPKDHKKVIPFNRCFFINVNARLLTEVETGLINVYTPPYNKQLGPLVYRNLGVHEAILKEST